MADHEHDDDAVPTDVAPAEVPDDDDTVGHLMVRTDESISSSVTGTDSDRSSGRR